MTLPYADSLIRYAASQPHDKVYDGMFGPLDAMQQQMDIIGRQLQAGGNALPPELWQQCRHLTGHAAMHILSPRCRDFVDAADKTTFLQKVSGDAYLAMNSLDVLREKIGELPVGGALDIQDVSSHIHQAKNALRGLARHAEYQRLGIQRNGGTTALGG